MEINMIRRYAFAVLLLTSLAASAEEPAHGRKDDRAHERAQRATGYIITQAPGYIITPTGTIIFPDAPPPTGDTSTLSGAGPNVSTGPVVGTGPEVGTGPVVGSGQ
jgi:hypothetical protein